MPPPRRHFTESEIRTFALDFSLLTRVQTRLRSEAPVGNHRGTMMNNIEKAIVAEVETLLRQELARLWTRVEEMTPRTAGTTHDQE